MSTRRKKKHPTLVEILRSIPKIETMSLPEAIGMVKAGLETLEDFAKAFHGGVRPETRHAFKMVIRAARKSCTRKRSK
jgi:hypothetical protein